MKVLVTVKRVLGYKAKVLSGSLGNTIFSIWEKVLLQLKDSEISFIRITSSHQVSALGAGE